MGIKHGGRKTRLYDIWHGIKARCYNPNNRAYKRYGGRGITMCDEWRDSFAAFRDWAVANGYSDQLTCDRKDTNGSYTPDNCRWVTPKTQANNRRDNRLLTHDGQTHTISEWAELTGINKKTIYARIDRYGWDVKRTLITQSRIKKESIRNGYS